MRKSCENLCFLRFCTHRRPQTCENTGFERIRITEPCVFTGLGPPMNAKPKKTQVFAAFSHGFLRMSLAFFFPPRLFRIFACLRPAPRRPSRSLGRADENAKGVSSRVRKPPTDKTQEHCGPETPPPRLVRRPTIAPREATCAFSAQRRVEKSMIRRMGNSDEGGR